MAIPVRLAANSRPDATLTHLECCLLRLGRMHVDAQSTSRGRDAVTSLAERGLMSTSDEGQGTVIVAEITHAGRRALAWIDGRPTTGLS